nr:hypothetical protein HmN_000206200 [Hymenolepis microstoma]
MSHCISVHVSCSPNRFLVCFQPPNRPPYQQLHQTLKDGTSIAYLTGEQQVDAVVSRNCVLKPYDFGHDGSLLVASGWELGPLRNFCVNVDVDKSQNRLPCGLFFKNETVVSMTGLLEVRTETHVWQSSIDMRFDLRCSTYIRSFAFAAVANVSNSDALAKSASSSTTATAEDRMSKIKSQDHQTSQRQESVGICLGKSAAILKTIKSGDQLDFAMFRPLNYKIARQHYLLHPQEEP